MINARDDIIELLNDYMDAQGELKRQAWVSDSEAWSGMTALYSNGIVIGKFREQDTATMQVLKRGVNDKTLFDEIILNINFHVEECQKLQHTDIMALKMLELYKKEQEGLQLYSLEAWTKKNCGWIYDEASGYEYKEIKVLIYLYYTFNNYMMEINHPYNSNVDNIKKVYQDSMSKHSQLFKYGVLELDEDRKLIPFNPPRVYDQNINKTFFIKNVPVFLLQQFLELMKKQQIGKLAVRLTNESGIDGKVDSQCLMEAVERGKIFELSSLGSCFVSKLYSVEYENCLWVSIEPEDITFEELCKDFNVYENTIVTQVIHMQYKMEDDVAYITHLDHEYIFYSVEEYEKRLSDSTQRGKAREKMKSFKIDDAEIPFNTQCSISRKDELGNDLNSEKILFLNFVLESYFEHIDLLKEYFQKIQMADL